MGAFQAGMQMGQKAYNDALAYRERQEQLAMDKERNERDRADFQRRQAQYDREDQAMAGLTNLQAGVTPEVQGAITQRYGMTPLQVANAAAGGADALKAQLAGYDAPDSYDLQGAGANLGGLQVAPVAPFAPVQLAGAPKRSQVLDAVGQVALARRDLGAYQSAMAGAATAREDELIAGVKIPEPGTPEYAAWGKQVGAFLNPSKSITVKAPDKNGIAWASVVTQDNDAAFLKLGRADQLKLARAHALMDMNPVRALEMIAEVNKDLAAAVARDYTLEMSVLGQNNDAMTQSVGIEDRRSAIREREADGAARRAAAARDAAADRAWAVVGSTRDGKGVILQNRLGERMVRQAPEGMDTRDLYGLPTGMSDSGKLDTLPEDGKRIRDDDGNVRTMTEGAWVLPGRVPPSRVGAAVISAGVPQHLLANGLNTGTVRIDPNGDWVAYGGAKYDYRDPEQMGKLTKLLHEDMRGDQWRAEVERRGATEVGALAGRYPAPPQESLPNTGRRFGALD